MVVVSALLLCLLLPLVGGILAGNPLEQYWEFPPLTRYVSHALFSKPIFLTGGIVLLLLVVIVCRVLGKNSPGALTRKSQGVFPLWGWFGLVLVVVSWVLAWTRFSWFASLQPYTFTPLWIGYILIISGLTRQRSGSCLACRRPACFFLLFGVGSLFWWYFEYLNRFVQNWYYLGIEDFTAAGYVLHASLCFATVLPAVVCTTELLVTLPLFNVSCPALGSVFFLQSPRSGYFVLIFSAAGLACLAPLPDYFFGLVWISPLLIITGLQMITGQPTIFSSLRRGNPRPLLLPPLAALICGFFWEMWNWQSLAHWQYSIPYVDRFHLFAMPVLGYAGYLPFGLECMLVATFCCDLDEFFGSVP